MTIYFYKVDAPYGCFSNFSPHLIELAGKKWATVEHYYQAHKFEGTKFEYLMAEIQAAPTPESAAKIGRNPKHQPRPDWDLRKCEIMYGAVWQKFNHHLDIQQVLLDTLAAKIVENSPVDYFWGCGIDRTGTNHLGQILMQVRDNLKLIDN
ncbi:NADAR family protein [Chamaesiphon sp. VAR_48_metabat_135_sub]|uniref:NADAR family protein n=1 Tax=Chamaesiphon sp. VAR_48_metabat_135_sub TaxID=2964699 RepID=UPI00286ACBCF|nr:NADAR family protein [Chamaesiphon sp. VAR_48_metabat_135_sub]